MKKLFKKLFEVILLPMIKKALESTAKALVPIVLDLIQEGLEKLINKALHNIAARNQDSLDKYKKTLKEELKNGLQEEK
jgi:hypothetical protein